MERWPFDADQMLVMPGCVIALALGAMAALSPIFFCISVFLLIDGCAAWWLR